MTKDEKIMEKWKCTLCDYVYDPTTGDIESGIAVNTAFEDLPDGWVCPWCGAPKDSFKKIE